METIQCMLESLKRMDFPFLTPEREEKILSQDPVVTQLTREIWRAPLSSREAIEQFFDALVKDFKCGEMFKHTEVVMAVLTACHDGSSYVFQDIALPFASSNAAEFHKVRLFARRLLRQDEEKRLQKRNEEYEFWSDSCWEEPF